MDPHPSGRFLYYFGVYMGCSDEINIINYTYNTLIDGRKPVQLICPIIGEIHNITDLTKFNCSNLNFRFQNPTPKNENFFKKKYKMKILISNGLKTIIIFT